RFLPKLLTYADDRISNVRFALARFLSTDLLKNEKYVNREDVKECVKKLKNEKEDIEVMRFFSSDTESMSLCNNTKKIKLYIHIHIHIHIYIYIYVYILIYLYEHITMSFILFTKHIIVRSVEIFLQRQQQVDSTVADTAPKPLDSESSDDSGADSTSEDRPETEKEVATGKGGGEREVVNTNDNNGNNDKDNNETKETDKSNPSSATEVSSNDVKETKQEEIDRKEEPTTQHVEQTGSVPLQAHATVEASQESTHNPVAAYPSETTSNEEEEDTTEYTRTHQPTPFQLPRLDDSDFGLPQDISTQQQSETTSKTNDIDQVAQMSENQDHFDTHQQHEQVCLVCFLSFSSRHKNK
ncbi:hypothetical protein RFI_27926, partial [Reticulomyxa filosa]